MAPEKALEMPLAGKLAENLLRAWAVGDAAQFRLEVERSLSLPSEDCEEGELERRTLLKAVAGRMQSSPNMLDIAAATTECGLYVRLLSHLATGCEGGHDGASAEYPWARRVHRMRR